MFLPLLLAAATASTPTGWARPKHLWLERYASASNSAPHLSYHNGNVVHAPRYYPVYWGGYWNTAAGVQERNYYDAFINRVAPDQSFASIVLEYSTKDTTLSAGSFGKSAVDAREPGASVGDNACDEIVEDQIDAGRLPPPDSNSVYIVFLPPGTESTTFAGLAGRSCKDYCGYHSAQIAPGTGNWKLRYIVMPHHDATCSGCVYAAFADNERDRELRSETITLSHEMTETQTDPDGAVVSFGWYDNAQFMSGEIGDLCEGTEAQLGGYSIQRMWSNEQNACVASGKSATAGGGCPAGEHDAGGYCVPNELVGCSTSSAGSGFLALAAGLVVLVLRRRRA